MGSSDGRGISLPQWVKGKMDQKLDLDAFSPPSHDDTFFYIRYRKEAKSGRKSEEVKEHKVLKVEMERGVGDLVKFDGKSIVNVARDMSNKFRVSKSLPSTPLATPEGSPRAMRKQQYCERFRERKIAEEAAEEVEQQQVVLDRKKSISMGRELGELNSSWSPTSMGRELRELNCWSPTSM